jgi:hypothetical protein
MLRPRTGGAGKAPRLDVTDELIDGRFRSRETTKDEQRLQRR